MRPAGGKYLQQSSGSDRGLRRILSKGVQDPSLPQSGSPTQTASIVFSHARQPPRLMLRIQRAKHYPRYCWVQKSQQITLGFFEFVKLRIGHGMCLSGAQPQPRLVLGANPDTGYTSMIYYEVEFDTSMRSLQISNPFQATWHRRAIW